MVSISIMGVDPGLRACGVALYANGHWCTATIRVEEHDLARRVEKIVERVAAIACGVVDVLVIEKPQVYQAERQEVDANDLVNLAVLVGAVLGRVVAKRVLLPLPAQWKGQVPKKIHHRRIRNKTGLDQRMSKDALDAVGLALFGVEHAESQAR